MPQAVEEYVNTKDFSRVDQIKRNILNLYRQGIGKHAEGYNLKVESIFGKIPAQLQKYEKNLDYHLLVKGQDLGNTKMLCFG